MIDFLALTGRSSAHVTTLPDSNHCLQPEAATAFLAMRTAAEKAGIDLAMASSWRDFARQRAIWNAKFRLEKPLRDTAGEIIDGHRLDPCARLEAIMRWSAIPGASRHHWGTDCDVYDRRALGEQALQLLPAEYAAGGHQANLHDWLQQHMHHYGFYQPYRTDRGGVCPEPWHLSYAPLALPCERGFDCEGLRALLLETAADASLRIEGHELLCTHLASWHARFVAAVDAPPVELMQAR